MIRLKYSFGLVLLFSLLLVENCDDLVFDDELPDSNTASFDYLWEECRDKYAFFEYKGIDWEAVYQEYRPQVNDNITQDSLFNVMWAMLNELRDGHVNLIAAFNVSRFNIQFLGPENINERVVQEFILGSDHYTTGPLQHTALAEGRIGYIRYSSFSGFIDEFDLAFALFRYSNTEGLILDLRQNGGGSIDNVFTLINRLADERKLLYRSRLKSGPGPNDFESNQEAYSDPEDEFNYIGKPVMVLVDRGSYSATSFFALATKAFPNIQLLGDTTGGGLGIPNGGQLPNGWTYRFSVSQTLSPDGENFEDGVPVDIPVTLDPELSQQGRDNVIERAIEEILN